jgi:hypothetical protein
MGRIVETLWNCPYCGSKGIRGGIQTCPNCGKTRSKDTKFYLPENITYVAEPVADKPDWYCPFCDSYNPHNEKNCKLCGAPCDKAKTYFDMLKEQGRTADLQNPDDDPVAPTCHESDTYDSLDDYDRNQPVRQAVRTDETPVVIPAYIAPGYTATTHPAKARKMPEFLQTARGRILTGIFLLILILTAIFIPKSKTVTIDTASWSRRIQIEQNTLIEENDWSVPGDAVEILRTRSEIHHYDRVLDHYETVTEQKSRQVQDGYDITYTYRDMGNGYAEEIEHRTPRYRTEYYTETHQEPVYRDEPVYQTKYYYTVWRYVYDHTESTSGISTTAQTSTPVWPEVHLQSDQRTGKRTEEYSVACHNAKNKTATYTVNDQTLWEQLIPGNTYKVKISAGHIREIT